MKPKKNPIPTKSEADIAYDHAVEVRDRIIAELDEQLTKEAPPCTQQANCPTT